MLTRNKQGKSCGFVLIAPGFMPAAVMLVVLIIAMLFLVTRNILIEVPVILYKVDTLATGFIFAAVTTPVLGLSWRYAQVNGGASGRRAADFSWLVIDYFGRRAVADVNAAIKTGLADAD